MVLAVTKPLACWGAAGAGGTSLGGPRPGGLTGSRGLSQAEWGFKPAAHRWSIAEIGEHLALTEEMFLDCIVPRLCASPRLGLDRDPQETDALILSAVPDPAASVVLAGRSSLAEAPPQLMPVGRGTADGSLRRFLENRERTSAFLEAQGSELRRRLLEHPALGPMDGYQCILFISPVIALNQSVAVAMSAGLEEGLKRIDDLGASGLLDHYYLFHAARADLLRRLHRRSEAADAYRRAMGLASNPIEWRFLQRRVREMEGL